MTRRRPRWLKALLVVVAGLLAAAVGLMVVVAQADTRQYEFWRELLISSPILSFLGATILVHRPRHPIGLVLVLSAAANSVALFAGCFSVAAPLLDWPLGDYGAWLENLLRGPAFMLGFGFLFHLYPTGVPLGRPGRWMVGAVAAAVAGSIVALAVAPGPLPDFPSVVNPFGIAAMEGPSELLETAGVFVLLAVGLVGGLATITVRLVRSEGAERLQIQVFLYASVMAVTGLLTVQWWFPWVNQGDLGSILWTFFPMTVVAAMAMAIVRYRLYEIDRLVSRTIAYGLLTALLVGVYLGLVFVIGGITPLEGELSVAASTLAVAALFNPLRRRIQSVVDQRFNRARYDAVTTMETLSRRLRADSDLGGVVEALSAATSATLHPTSISVWLREGNGSRSGR